MATKEFEVFFLECRGDVTSYYKEVLTIHKHLSNTLEKLKNEKSREENLKDLWGSLASRTKCLFECVDSTRSIIEKRIEELSSLIYRESRDKRYPRAIHFGCDVNRDVTIETEKEAKSFLKWVKNYQGLLFQLLSEVDSVVSTHNNFALSHRAAILDQDDQAWLAYQRALNQVFAYIGEASHPGREGEV
jgi:hypothetical protein